MICACLLIFISSSSFTKILGIIPWTATASGINIIFMPYSHFSYLVMSKYLPHFLLPFIFTLKSTKTAKSTIPQVPFLFLSLTICGRLASVGWSLLWKFSFKRSLLDFHWGLSDSMSSQAPRTVLSILAVLNNTVVWVVFILLLISNSFRFYPSFTFGTTVTVMSNCFFFISR